MDLSVGIRWEVHGVTISADEVKKLLTSGNRFEQLVSGRKECPVVVTTRDGMQVVYFEKKVISSDGSMSDPHEMTAKLEKYFQKKFGFNPERIVNTENNIIPWSQYWADVSRRISALPAPQGSWE